MPPEQTSSGFGAKLREARERRGVTLRQIANATKISVGVLESLERNDISKLPGGIFGRAFIRSYAVEVGLDPKETIQDFIAQIPNDSVTMGHSMSGQGEDDVAVETDRLTAGTFVWLVAVSVPIAAGLFYFSTLRSAPTASEPTAATSALAPVPAAALPDAQSLLAAPASDQLTVVVTAKRPCWVSAMVDGRKAIERLLKAGEQQTVTVHSDMVLTAGDASAIALQFNGADARELGKAGEVVTAKITLANYKDYLQAK